MNFYISVKWEVYIEIYVDANDCMMSKTQEKMAEILKTDVKTINADLKDILRRENWMDAKQLLI